MTIDTVMFSDVTIRTTRSGEARIPITKKLLELLASTELEILNRGNEPTFYTAVRRKVLCLF